MNKLIYRLSAAAVILLGALGLTGCKGDSEPTEAVQLSLSLDDLAFMGTKGDSKQLTINSNCHWEITNCPEWLLASSSSGQTTTTITLTTCKENTEREELKDELVVTASNGTDSKSAAISLTQRSNIADCFTVLAEGTVNIMTYGIGCVFAPNPNTNYFHYQVFPTDEYNRFTPKELEQQCSSWPKIKVTSDTSNLKLGYGDCQPNASYTLVTVSYDSNGNIGETVPFPFTTMSKDEQARANVDPAIEVATEDEDGNMGRFWRVNIKKNQYCKEYVTFLVASSSNPLESAFYKTGASGQYGQSIKLAEQIAIECMTDEYTHSTHFLGFKSEGEGREKFRKASLESGAKYIERYDSDKYIQVLTWSKDAYGSWSGIIVDQVYELTGDSDLAWTLVIDRTGFGADIPLDEEYSLAVNQSSLSFTKDASSKTFQISGNDSWTVTSGNTSWCTVIPSSGQGSKTVTVSVTANSESSARSTTLSVKGSKTGKSYSISISQERGGSNEINKNGFGSDKTI